jgi:hypothetical protein
MFGSLIVRGPDENNPNRKLYDYDIPEHSIVFSDWMHHLAEEDFPGMTSRSVLTESVLINGNGIFYNVRHIFISSKCVSNFYFLLHRLHQHRLHPHL